MTIPTESGAGGASSWRVADAMLAAGQKVQTARQIVNENTWLAPAFRQFGEKVTHLPVDQHLVAALCAPRPLLITENTALEWLGPKSCYLNAIATHKVWEALGVPLIAWALCKRRMATIADSKKSTNCEPFARSFCSTA